jgi:hypothetical protein
MTTPPTIAVTPHAGRILPGWAKLLPTLALFVISGVALAQPRGITSGDMPLAASRFPTYVAFQGDKDNGLTLSTQARARNIPLKPPWFATGFYVPLGYLNFGALITYGNQSANGNGVLIFAFHGDALAAYQKWGSGENILAIAPGVFGGVACKVGQWAHTALIVAANGTASIVLDGVLGTSEPGVSINWPTSTGPTETLDLTFGSWGNRPPGGGSDADNLNGGLRDWVVVTGTPTPAELEAYRNGGDPAQIWGAARIVGYWHFTSNPATGEPDASGHGHMLTYSDAGSAAGHSLPVLVTPAALAKPTPGANH